MGLRQAASTAPAKQQPIDMDIPRDVVVSDGADWEIAARIMRSRRTPHTTRSRTAKEIHTMAEAAVHELGLYDGGMFKPFTEQET